MTKAYRNGDVLQEVDYSKWNNDVSLTFEQRTMQNFVETIAHNDLSGSNYAMTRAFVDPLGRNTLSAASVSNAPNDLIVSTYTQFDSWDRPTHIYKPFALTTVNGMNSLLYSTPQANIGSNAPYITKIYQDDPRSRIIKEAKYGNDINGNRVVESEFCILDGQQLMTELGLSISKMTDWIQDANTQTGRATNLFLRSTITDEDGKQLMEYANAIGQKITSVRYNGAEQILTLFYYDSRGNLTRLNRHNGLFETCYNYQYLGQTNKMTGINVDEIVGTTINYNVANYTYNYDSNGNLTYDSKRNITVTDYGRANLHWELNTTPSNISYLYDVADLRIYKKEAPKGEGGSTKEENIPLSNFNAFPNPTTGNVSIKVDLKRPTNIQYRLLDAQGRVLNTWWSEQAKHEQHSRDLSHLPNGMYLIQVLADGYSETRKVLLQR
jgi:uncharacterized protein YkuJ